MKITQAPILKETLNLFQPRKLNKFYKSLHRDFIKKK